MAAMPSPEQLKRREVLASFDNYAAAQEVVDELSDERFPVEHVSIVGRGLTNVESVLGRLSWGRAALSGLAMGAWFGVLIGLFVSLFANSDGAVLPLILLGLLYGAAFGIVFGLVSYNFTGGKRDFVSRNQLVAEEYQVTVDIDYISKARTIVGVGPGEVLNRPLNRSGAKEKSSSSGPAGESN